MTALRFQRHPFWLVLIITGLLALLLGSVRPASAQGQGIEGSSFPAEGTWLVQMEGSTNFYLILKSGGEVSLLYANNPDTRLYEGRWEPEGSGIKMDWPSGRTVRLFQGTAGFEASVFGEDGEVIDVRRIPEREVGQWTVAPEGPGAGSGVLAEVEGYFGTWEIRRENGSTYFLVIEDDRTVGSNYPDTRFGPGGLIGSWRRQGDDLHIFFNSGHYMILRKRPQDYVALLFEPGRAIDPNAEIADPAAKVRRSPPQAWLDAYRQERESFGRVSGFNNRRQVTRFYQGGWSLLTDEGERARLTLGRFGGARLKMEGRKLRQGRWSTSGQSVLVRWSDNSRSFMSPVHTSVVYSFFNEGDPLDGAPAVVFGLRPENEAQLEKYRERLAERTRQVRARERAREERLENPEPLPPPSEGWLDWIPFL